MNNFKVVDDSEYEDFKNLLNEYGFSETDFSLSEKEGPWEGTGTHAITGQVAITNKNTGKIKTYEAGHGTAWVAALRTDLSCGYFSR